MLTHNTSRIACFGGDMSSEFLTYQLSTVGYLPTVALTGNGELGFDSGEKSKSLGSGVSMVARLKLKGIDGGAPPGVEPAA